MQLIQLSAIRTDGGTQMREELSQSVYMDYRDKWLADVKFDPIVLFHDGATYWLADGFHRFYGAREAKRKDIPAVVHQGTQRDAKLYACGANDTHGLPRTNADKRLAVKVLLKDEEWSKWSDRKIAEVAKVGHVFVSNMRKELFTVNSSPSARSASRKGKDGKVRRPPMRKPTPPPTDGDSPPAAEKSTPPAGPPASPPPTPPKPRHPAPGESQFVKEFLSLWSRCDDVAKAAIRAIVLESTP